MVVGGDFVVEPPPFDFPPPELVPDRVVSLLGRMRSSGTTGISRFNMPAW
jgi:hypothetical protein